MCVQLAIIHLRTEQAEKKIADQFRLTGNLLFYLVSFVKDLVWRQIFFYGILFLAFDINARSFSLFVSTFL